MPAEVMATLMPMFIFFGVFFGIFFVVGILNYVLRGIAILKMSQNRGISNGGLGFVPIAHRYQLGKLAGTIEFGNKKIKNPGLWKLLLPIIYGAVFAVGYVAIIIWYAFQMVAVTGAGMIDETAMMGTVLTFFSLLIVFVVVMQILYVVIILLNSLVLHKIFSLYVGGQKPVFYLILSLFVPLAEPILLFRLKDKPLITNSSVEPKIGETELS